jgi:hypothetical protein
LDPALFWGNGSERRTEQDGTDSEEEPEEEEQAELPTTLPEEEGDIEAATTRPQEQPEAVAEVPSPAGTDLPAPFIPKQGVRPPRIEPEWVDTARPPETPSTRPRRKKSLRLVWIPLVLAVLAVGGWFGWKRISRHRAGTHEQGSPGADARHEESQKEQVTPAKIATPDAGTAETALVPLVSTEKRGTINLKLNSDPPGALVYIDGERRGATPTTVRGIEAHREISVRIEAEGYRPWEQRYTFDESSRRREIHAGLMQDVDCDTGSGWVYVASDPPGATVELNAKRLPGKTPMVINDVCAEVEHEIRIQAVGFKAWRRYIKVPDGDVLNLTAKLLK